MQQLVTEFQHSLEALDSVIASRLMPLALEAARQVIGQATTMDGSALLRQIQQLLADSTLHPVGCKLSTEDGDLDTSVATRWQELCRLAAPGEF
ncbi:Flagellar assembly protein FliH|nr:Flagellar assembly protein FliH [Candidatus Pantoea persica]